MRRPSGAPPVDPTRAQGAARPAMRTDGRAFWIGAVVIAAIGGVIRLLQVAWVTGREPLSGDAFYYYWQARHNANGHWFVQPLLYTNWGVWIPGADHPPGFVTLLTVFDLVGIRSPLAQRSVLAALGTATIVVIMLVAREVVNERAALIAGGIAAIAPNLWANDGRIMSETMFVFCFAVGLYGFFRFRNERRLCWLMLLVVSLTLAASARPESLLLFPLVVLPVVWAATKGEWRRRVGLLAVAALIPIVTFAPWIAYNTARFDHLVIMSTGAGQTIAQGNCSLSYYGSSMGLNQFKCLEMILPPAGRDVNIAEQDTAYRKAAFAYMRKHADRLPKVVLAREGRTWGLWRVSQQRRIDHTWENRGSLRVVALQQWSWWILAALALGGAVIWRRRRLGLYPLVMQFAVTVAMVGMTFGNTRYRAGVEVCAVLLAATAIDALVGWWQARRADVDPAPQPL